MNITLLLLFFQQNRQRFTFGVGLDKVGLEFNPRLLIISRPNIPHSHVWLGWAPLNLYPHILLISRLKTRQLVLFSWMNRLCLKIEHVYHHLCSWLAPGNCRQSFC